MMTEAIERLNAVITALETVEVHGTHNLDMMLASLQTIRQTVAILKDMEVKINGKDIQLSDPAGRDGQG